MTVSSDLNFVIKILIIICIIICHDIKRVEWGSVYVYFLK